MSQSFEYEFIFNNEYDPTVFSSAPVEQNIEFQELLKNTVETMFNILNLYSGVKTFSSFITYNDKSYKVSVATL